MTFGKPVGPNGTVITAVQGQAGSALRALPDDGGELKIDTWAKKAVQRVSF